MNTDSALRQLGKGDEAFTLFKEHPLYWFNPLYWVVLGFVIAAQWGPQVMFALASCGAVIPLKRTISIAGSKLVVGLTYLGLPLYRSEATDLTKNNVLRIRNKEFSIPRRNSRRYSIVACSGDGKDEVCVYTFHTYEEARTIVDQILMRSRCRFETTTPWEPAHLRDTHRT